MPYDVAWMIEARVLSIRIRDSVSIDEVREIAAQSQQYTLASTSTLYIVVDLSELNQFPNNLFQIKQLLNDYITDEPPTTIIYGVSALLGLIIKALTRLLGLPFIYVDNRSQALVCLQELDPDLAIEIETLSY
jgi:hypothetical protein